MGSRLWVVNFVREPFSVYKVLNTFEPEGKHWVEFYSLFISGYLYAVSKTQLAEICRSPIGLQYTGWVTLT